MIFKRLIAKSIIFILIAIIAFLMSYFFYLIKPNYPAKTKAGNFRLIRSIYGSDSDQFDRPHDIAADSSGNLYITDSADGKVMSFDRNGSFLRYVGKTVKSIHVKSNDTKDSIINPIGISISDNDEIFVADRSLEKIVVFGSNGDYIRNWKVTMPIKPIVKDGKIYVSTYGPFFIFDLEGKPITGFGKRGHGTYDFDFPNGMVIDNQENIIIADSNNKRLKSITSRNAIRWVDGQSATDPKQSGTVYQLPTGLALDELGLLYSVDTFDSLIRVFLVTEKGIKFIDAFGEEGAEDGKLIYPVGLAYLGNRRFAIVDEGNARVQIFEIALSSKMKELAEKSLAATKIKPPTKNLQTRLTGWLYSLVGL